MDKDDDIDIEGLQAEDLDIWYNLFAGQSLHQSRATIPLTMMPVALQRCGDCRPVYLDSTE